MEDVMMGGLVELTVEESVTVYGGRNESVARVVEFVAQCIGAFAKMMYLTAKRGPKAIADQMSAGYYPKF